MHFATLVLFVSAATMLQAAPSPAVVPSAVKPGAGGVYRSPYFAALGRALTTINITTEGRQYIQELLYIDENIENFYQGDGPVQPTEPYSPIVNETVLATKIGTITASGSGPVDASTISMLRSFTQLATVSYCDLSAINAWQCNTCRSSAYGRPSNILSAEVSNMRFYAAFLPNQNQIIVSFRGSSNLANWISNLNFIAGDYWIGGVTPRGVKFHNGFQNLYRDISATVRSFVRQLSQIYPSAGITFAGHSLGGSIAIHAALDLANTNYAGSFLGRDRIRVVTAGEPRIGNREASTWVSRQQTWGGGLFRIVNYDDLVPHLPYQWMGSRHHLRQHWIDKNGNLVFCNDVNASDQEDTNCMNTKWWTSTSAHGIYLGVLMGSGC